MLKKIKAGALQFTMFVVLVIALLLASFVVLVSTHKQFEMKTDFVLQTVQNSNSGIDYLLKNEVTNEDTLFVGLADKENTVLKLYQDYWGIFEKGVAVSEIKKKEFRKVALLGGAQPEIDRVALYLEELDKPLVLVGDTKIQGVAYLPEQGIRTGNISGHSYYGKELIYGDIKKSGALPKIKPKQIEHIESILTDFKSIEQEQFLDIEKDKNVKNSFYKLLKLFYNQNEIDLVGVSLTGHIIVQSESKITVDASSKLQDVILKAPIVEINDGVNGTFQVFASKKIILGIGCKLNYPSALVINEESSSVKEITNAEESPLIKINKNSIVKGVVAFWGETSNYLPQVYIGENVIIKGEVYCDKNLELQGTVHGSIFTSGFVSVQSGSMYQNHIYNGEILIDSLPQEYVGLQFEPSKKGVAKWLY